MTEQAADRPPDAAERDEVPTGPRTPETVTQLVLFVDGRAEDIADLPQAHERAQQHNVWLWAEVVEPSQHDLDALVDSLQLHRQTVEHAVETQQRPRFNRLGQLSTVVLHPARYDDASETVALGQLTLLLGPNFLISVVCDADTQGVEDARERLLEAPWLAALGPKAGCYAVLDDVVDDFQPVEDGLAHDIDQIGDSLDTDSDKEVATRIYRLSRQVTTLLSAVSPMEALITQVRKSLVRRDLALMEPEQGDAPAGHHPASGSAPPGQPDAHRAAQLDALFADVGTHVLRVEERADGMRTNLSNALALASTLASQKATDVSLVQNDQTKKVSSWAAIFAVPTVISGVYGMNFTHFPSLDWRYGFFGSLTAMVLGSVILYLVFKRHNWM